ncbi:MAG: hypothetical protein ABI895_25295 [Deltaproteobacteria bacterium]
MPVGPPRSESRAVVQTTTYPNWQSTLDLGLLELDSDSTVPPAQIAFGCASAFIVDGAPIRLLGYGDGGGTAPPLPAAGTPETLSVSGRLTLRQQRQLGPVAVRPGTPLRVTMTGTGEELVP